MELALVCFGSCHLMQLVVYGSLLPLAVEDNSSQMSKTKVSSVLVLFMSICCLLRVIFASTFT